MRDRVVPHGFRALATVLASAAVVLMAGAIAPPGAIAQQVVDLRQAVGTADRAAFLSPQGDRYAYLERSSISVFSLPDNELLFTAELGEGVRPSAEGFRWSPDGRYLAFPDNDAFLYLVDADIRVLDMETREVRVLTPDEQDGGFLSPAGRTGPFFLDVAVAWSADGRLAVLRYPISAAFDAPGMEIVVVDPATGRAETRASWLPEAIFLGQCLEWGGEQVFVGRSPQQDMERLSGLDLVDLEAGGRRSVLPLPAELAPVFALQASADAESLIAVNLRYRMTDPVASASATDGVFVVDPADGSAEPVDPDRYVLQAGFSPEGSSIVYLVSQAPPGQSPGVYVRDAPGQAGRLVYELARPGTTTPRGYAPLTWASNGSLLVADRRRGTLLLVDLD